MALSVGDKCPEFSLVSLTTDGPVVVESCQLIAGSPAVLFFIPMAFTGVCTEEFCTISNDLAEYESLNASVYGISGDNPFAQQAWAEKENFSLPMLSDYEHEVAGAFGIAYEAFLPEKNLTMGGVAKRSVFVVDGDGFIRYAEVLESPGDMPDLAAVKEFLKSM